VLPTLADGYDNFDQYRKILQREQIKAKVIKRRFSNKLEPKTILEILYKGDTITEKLRKGFEVDKGETVEFIITERGGGTVDIPNLICQKYQAAQFIVDNYNLSVGSIIEDATVTNRGTAYIWRQKPAYSSSRTLRIGQQIDLYITQNKPDDCSGNWRKQKPIETPPTPEVDMSDPSPEVPGEDKPEEENEDFDDDGF